MVISPERTYLVDAPITDSLDGKFRRNKDPQANLDYAYDWSTYLGEIFDTIAAVELLTTGVEVSNSSFDNTTVIVWVTGGTVEDTATIVCRITTVGGRVDDRTIYLKIKDM